MVLQEAEGFLKTVLWGMGIHDFAFPLGVLVWLVVLMLPIHDLDCEDAMTGALYSGFVGTSGIALVLGAPGLYNSTEDIVSMIVSALVFFGLPVLRWVRTAIRQNAMRTEVQRKEEQQKNAHNMEL